jgi:hypothetical protein
MAEENTNPDPSVEPPAPTEQGGAHEAWAPSKEEWDSLQENNKRLAESLEGLTSAFAEPPQPTSPQNQEQFDFSSLDMTDPYQAAWLMEQVVNERLSSVTPYVRNAAQDQGQRQMQELLSQHEVSLKKDYPGGFDKKLAEKAAFAFFDETGNAEGSVAAAAKYAAEVRKEERNAAIEEYKRQNTRGDAFGDFGAEGTSGVRAAEALKTYDEVLDKWTQQSEV